LAAAKLSSRLKRPQTCARVYTDRETAVVELDVHYTRFDGESVTLPCCNVFRMWDGLIKGYRSFVDATPVAANV
jgi:argonaute-like protein implicated in RNA metabolism and viral defense